MASVVMIALPPQLESKEKQQNVAEGSFALCIAS